ncbi:hypothetical protein wTpre_1186 [Wolbachia endosymbiont of Trichogramma pretiosum]|nr:hypothetical protein wTpre_1186 [Wolbachia endosymbiont of Trichogramma pretiosum]
MLFLFAKKRKNTTTLGKTNVIIVNIKKRKKMNDMYIFLSFYD